MAMKVWVVRGVGTITNRAQSDPLCDYNARRGIVLKTNGHRLVSTWFHVRDRSSPVVLLAKFYVVQLTLTSEMVHRDPTCRTKYVVQPWRYWPCKYTQWVATPVKPNYSA